MLLMFGFGMAFFLRGHDPSSPYGRRVTACAIVFMTVAGTVFPAVFYLKRPDWMWMYYLDSSDVPSWLGWYILANYWLPFLAAYLIGARLSLRGRVVAFVLAAIGQVAIQGYTWDRYFHVGTTDEYLAGTAGKLPESDLNLWLNLGAAAYIAMFVAILLFLRKEHRRLTPA